MNWLKCLCIFNPNKKYLWNRAWLKNYSLKNIGIIKKGLICTAISSKSTKTYDQNLLRAIISYSESEPDFDFAINSASNFDPTFSQSKSEPDDSGSDFSSVFMNLDICVFLPYICIVLNKLVDDFLSIFKTESIVMQVMQV